MLKTRFAAAAAALLFSSAMIAPANAAKITYTYSSLFSGSLNGQAFTNVAATFTGVGDTNNTTTYAGFVPAITLSSLTAAADGPYTITTPFDFAFVSNFGSGVGAAGFTNSDDSGEISFFSTGMLGWNGVSSIGPVATTALASTSTFQTDRGTVSITGQGAGTFSATVAGVPEPATWALMILGFGAVGGAMRRRQSIATKIRFA